MQDCGYSPPTSELDACMKPGIGLFVPASRSRPLTSLRSATRNRCPVRKCAPFIPRDRSFRGRAGASQTRRVCRSGQPHQVAFGQALRMRLRWYSPCFCISGKRACTQHQVATRARLSVWSSARRSTSTSANIATPSAGRNARSHSTGPRQASSKSIQRSPVGVRRYEIAQELWTRF